MTVLPLKGLKSYFALQAYAKMLLGLKMLPMYGKYDFYEFYQMVEEMPPEDQERVIREGVFLGEITDEEILALARFAADGNGVPYCEANMKSMGPEEIFEIAIAVCLEIAKIKPRLTTESEKKKLNNFSVDLRSVFIHTPDILLEDAIDIAFYQEVQFAFGNPQNQTPARQLGPQQNGAHPQR